MWVHKKHLGFLFLGNYELKKNGQTHFHLVCTNKKGRKWEVKYRSWQKARLDGWVKADEV